MKLKTIQKKLKIDVTPERMWEVLSKYGDVSNFHAGVVESHKERNSENKASLGSERVCNIVDLGLHITLKERIVDFIEGDSYKYEVYEWKNFPIQKMLFGFKILRTNKPHIMLALEIDYKAKPAFLTPLMAGKMRRLASDILLGYKHYAETGETRTPIKELKSRYKANLRAEIQYG